MEIVGPKKRESMSILYQIPFNVGHTTLPLFSYFLRDWRWFQFAISIVSVIYISYYWILPESPRWLLANGKIDEVEKLLVTGAERNNRSTKTIRSDLDEHMKRKALLTESALKEKARGTLIDLFRYPNLRIRTFIMGFNWLVCGLTYFGVSQYIGEISGNIFINVAISGVLGIPGTLIAIPAIKILGRKKALILSNCVAGISLLLIAVLGKKGSWVQVALASIGVFGMSVSFPNVYLYGGELFPTVARNAGMGFVSMAARIGAMVAPFVSGTSSVYNWMPAVLFGCPPLIASLLVLLLPETKGQALPETIEDGENFGKKKSGEK